MAAEKNKVELLGYYGSDTIIACSAWTSTSRNLTDKKRERIPKLINMLWRDGHECYDDKTEVLTKRGWVLFSNLKDSDEVCSVDPSSLVWKFEKPSRIVSYNYDKPMYYVNAKHIDIAVTENHRLLTSRKKKADGSDYGAVWGVETPQDVSGKSRKYVIAAKNQNSDVLDENFAKLLGFFIGDGYSKSAYRCSFHLRKKRKIDYLKSLGCNVEDKKGESYVINGTEFDFTSCYDKDKNKIIPFDIYKLGPNDVKNIFDGLINSDGSEKGRGYTECVFHNTSNPLIEQLSILSCLNDFVFTEHKNGPTPTCRRFLISNRVHPEISNMKSRQLGKDEWIHYKGKVYCATVSTGFIMVRRNGKPVVCGNTPFEKGVVHFLVDTDIATHIHLLKHRVASMNAESARYKELKEDKYLLPQDWKGIRISNIDEALNTPSDDWHARLEEYTQEGNRLYHACLADLEPVLGRKRAKESARFFKTYNSQIQGDVTFNMRSFANFIKLRRSEHAQLEIREVSDEMLNLVENIEGEPFKHTLEAWRSEGVIDEIK